MGAATPDQKRDRKDVSVQYLAKFNRNTQDFLRLFVIVDETWIHHTPESKKQSKQSVLTRESEPQKAKTVLSTGKLMATVFWDSQGIILIDYLGKGKTITRTYYASLLARLKAKLQKKNGHDWYQSAVSLTQRTGSHLYNSNDKNTRTEFRIDSSSVLFSRLGVVRLLSVPQLKHLAWWETILVQWRSNRYRKCVFSRPREILLYWREEKTGISPD